VTTPSGLHVGYLVQQFPPEVGAGPARVVEMAQRWRAAGAEVTVVTGLPSRQVPGQRGGTVDPAYRGRAFMTEEHEGIHVLRSWLYSSSRGGFARTIFNNASFMVTSALHGTARLRGADVLIASSPPFFPHIAGDAVSRMRRIPLVLEVRDLWPDYLVGMGVLRAGRPATRALFALERALLRRAARVVVVTESFRRRVIEKGVAAERVAVIPNGVDTSAYFAGASEPPVEPLRRRDPGEFLVGYLGTFGAGQALSAVVEAAALLADEDPTIRIVLTGDGPEREKTERRARELAVPNVEFHGSIPKDRTRAFYTSCDACLVPLAPVAVFQDTVPSKIFETMACERPVLASLDGEGRRIVEESGGGLAVPPGDPRAIADGIRRLKEMSPEARAAMGARGRRYVDEHYGRASLADRYLALLEDVARERKRRAGVPRIA
jgi:glycosyltransferase involved in cell wall biosynthesis